MTFGIWTKDWDLNESRWSQGEWDEIDFRLNTKSERRLLRQVEQGLEPDLLVRGSSWSLLMAPIMMNNSTTVQFCRDDLYKKALHVMKEFDFDRMFVAEHPWSGFLGTEVRDNMCKVRLPRVEVLIPWFETDRGAPLKNNFLQAVYSGNLKKLKRKLQYCWKIISGGFDVVDDSCWDDSLEGIARLVRMST